MKRVRSACILQTLVFQQKDAAYFAKDKLIAMNREEVDKYRETLNKNGIRYQIIDEIEQQDGAITIRVRKQYNDKTDVDEYFD